MVSCQLPLLKYSLYTLIIINFLLYILVWYNSYMSCKTSRTWWCCNAAYTRIQPRDAIHRSIRYYKRLWSCKYNNFYLNFNDIDNVGWKYEKDQATYSLNVMCTLTFHHQWTLMMPLCQTINNYFITELYWNVQLLLSILTISIC